MNLNHVPQERVNKISFTRPDHVDKKLYVITPIFNSQRFRSRWKLYNEFEQYVLDSGAHLITIEATFGERHSSITERLSDKHTVIKVHAKSEIWIKENLINIAISRAPEDAEYFATIDADIKFQRSDWVGETIQKLQHYDVIQMFRVAADLDANGIPYMFNRGFIYDYLSGLPFKKKFEVSATVNKIRKTSASKSGPYGGGQDCPDCPDCPPTQRVPINNFHPGFAWAYRRTALSDLGGLFEYGILGAGDNHMATSLIGECEKSIHPKMQEEYKQQIRIWQARALKYINGNFGYMDGIINHAFHGAKKNRKYGDRWNILVNNKYTPSTDIKRDVNGVFFLEGNKPKMRDEIRQYFSQRNEDNIDMQGVVGFLD